MRFVENGIAVKMTISVYKIISVDITKDLEAVRYIIALREDKDKGGS